MDARNGIVSYERPSLDRMKELLVVFADAFEDHESYQSAIPSDEYLNGLLAREDFIPLVAVEDDKVVGGLVMFCRSSSSSGRDLYLRPAVDEPYRRQGIATGLINKLREIAPRARRLGDLCSGRLW